MLGVTLSSYGFTPQFYSQCQAASTAPTTPAHAPAPPPAGCVSAKTCESLETQYGGWPLGSYTPTVCGESDAPACFTSSQTAVNGWSGAQASCFEVGARLCTPQELQYGAGWGTGCGYNSNPVWTGAPCRTVFGSSGHYAVQFPPGSNIDSFNSQQICEEDAVTHAAVRCCADHGTMTDHIADRLLCDPYAAMAECSSASNCTALGWRLDLAGTGDVAVCGESDVVSTVTGADSAGCTSDASWATADAICLSAGARLCTVEELEADETAGTGCGFDAALSWSRDNLNCSTGQHTAVIGRSTSSASCMTCVAGTTVCLPDSTPSAVRCCADTDATESPSCLPGGAVPAPPPALVPLPSGCVSRDSCATLHMSFGGWPNNTYVQGCGESDNGFDSGANNCFGNDDNTIIDWQQAASLCFEAGARLCTATELQYGAGKGTGCGHDAAYVWSSDSCVGGHLVSQFNNASGNCHDDGSIQGLADCSEQRCIQDDYDAAVRCCADPGYLTSDPTRITCDAYAAQQVCTSAQNCTALAFGNAYGDPAVCGESDIGAQGQCWNAVTWSQAETFCLGAGARLCTVEEVRADETRSSGCMHDNRLIWTRDAVTCNPGQYVVESGSSVNNDGTTHCQDATATAAVRCCADAVVDTDRALSPA
jgi:hypothetical protein